MTTRDVAEPCEKWVLTLHQNNGVRSIAIQSWEGLRYPRYVTPITLGTATSTRLLNARGLLNMEGCAAFENDHTNRHAAED
jgi:hypothetical protein